MENLHIYTIFLQTSIAHSYCDYNFKMNYTQSVLDYYLCKLHINLYFSYVCNLHIILVMLVAAQDCAASCKTKLQSTI